MLFSFMGCGSGLLRPIDKLGYVRLFAALRRAAPYHEIRDDDLNGLVVLVERRRSHLDQSLIWTDLDGRTARTSLSVRNSSPAARAWPANSSAPAPTMPPAV